MFALDRASTSSLQCLYMSEKRREGSFINLPFQTDKGVRPVVVCPKCGNDGMDGSIDAKSLQWGLKRICLRCNYEWSGGIGVQQAVDPGDTTPSGEPAYDPDERGVEFTGAPFRDPGKNFDSE